jgi:xanthine/CO dehydrogenase XdhC/CoxF family maturation factor
MTHNYGNDKQIVSRLMETGIRYIGAMGPKSRTAKMFAEIESGGGQITDQMREKVHGPVGLDIGAMTPEGIALSIIAEVQAFVGGREGGFLKKRSGSIYGRL